MGSDSLSFPVPVILSVRGHRGITIGILAVIALAIGLGCFIHTGKAKGVTLRMGWGMWPVEDRPSRRVADHGAEWCLLGTEKVWDVAQSKDIGYG